MFGWRKTNRHGGGLRVTRDDMRDGVPVGMPKNFRSPRSLDGTAYTMPSNDQGLTQACSGFATSGGAEALSWKLTHVPAQFDAFGLFRATVEDDPSGGKQGATLQAAFDTAVRIGMIPPGYTRRLVRNTAELRFAMHESPVPMVIAGFAITDEWQKTNRWTGAISVKRRPRQTGNHATLVNYYDAEGIGMDGSWGTDYGLHGWSRMTWDQSGRQFIYGLAIIPDRGTERPND